MTSITCECGHVQDEHEDNRKLGNRVRYDRADLEAWMTKNKKRSTSETG